MAAYLQAQGVPLGAIVQDHAGNDTMETTRHAAALAGPDISVVVVSQWFHLPRTMLAMRRFGLKNVSGAWPRWFEARDAYSFLREAAALPFYVVKPVDPTQ